ncbi:hypothetical protein BC830DRAFT_1117446 [Chytriomyces sp. MP71]|nr:hypothetical protein BC830DRAFT_1117446 [Chytriomyces sp. MP71]
MLVTSLLLAMVASAQIFNNDGGGGLIGGLTSIGNAVFGNNKGPSTAAPTTAVQTGALGSAPSATASPVVIVTAAPAPTSTSVPNLPSTDGGNGIIITAIINGGDTGLFPGNGQTGGQQIVSQTGGRNGIQTTKGKVNGQASQTASNSPQSTTGMDNEENQPSQTGGSDLPSNASPKSSSSASGPNIMAIVGGVFAAIILIGFGTFVYTRLLKPKKKNAEVSLDALMLEASSSSSYAPTPKSKSPTAPLRIVTSTKPAESPSRRPSDAESTLSPASTIQGSQVAPSQPPMAMYSNQQGYYAQPAGYTQQYYDAQQQQQWAQQQYYAQQHALQQQHGYGYAPQQ